MDSDFIHFFWRLENIVNTFWDLTTFSSDPQYYSIIPVETCHGINEWKKATYGRQLIKSSGTYNYFFEKKNSWKEAWVFSLLFFKRVSTWSFWLIYLADRAGGRSENLGGGDK